MKKFTLLFLLLIFMLSACKQPPSPTNNQSDSLLNGTQSNNSVTEKENNNHYQLHDVSDEKITIAENKKVFSDSGITISLPINWNCKELNAEDATSYFFRHPELNDKCEFIYEVTSTEFFSKKRTEEEYLEYLSYDNHKDIKIDSFTEEKVGGYNSTKIVSFYSFENSKFIRIDYDYIVIGVRLYSFTITYPVSEADDLASIFDSIVNSIKFKDD